MPHTLSHIHKCTHTHRAYMHAHTHIHTIHLQMHTYTCTHILKAHASMCSAYVSMCVCSYVRGINLTEVRLLSGDNASEKHSIKTKNKSNSVVTVLVHECPASYIDSYQVATITPETAVFKKMRWMFG